MRARILPVVAGAGGVLLLLGDTLTGSQMLFFRDTLHHYLVLKEMQAAAWSAGTFPLWNPLQFAGVPLAADPVAQTFYPPGWIFALPFDTVALYHLYLAIHVGLAFAGAYRLGRALGLEPAPACVAGSVFALGGPFASNLVHLQFLCAYAWAPWVLEAFERALGEGAAGPRRTLALAGRVALPWAMQILAGDPQAAILTGLALAVRAWAVTASLRGRDRMRPALLVLAALVGAAALAAVQIVPAVEFLGESNREAFVAEGGRLSWSFHPARFAELFLPNFFGGLYPEMDLGLWHQREGAPPAPEAPYLLCVYAGASVLGLFTARLGTRGRPWPWRSYAVLGGLGLLLSLGTWGGLYLLFDRIIPTWSSYRYPERCLYLALLAAAMAAGFAARRVVASEARPSWSVAIPWILGAALLAAAIAAGLAWEPAPLRPGFDAPLPQGAAVTALAHAGAAMLAVAVLAPWAGRLGAWAPWLAVAVVIVDLGLASRAQAYRAPRDDVLVASPIAEAIRRETRPVAWPRIDRDPRLRVPPGVDRGMPALLRQRRFEVRTLLGNLGWRFGLAHAVGYSSAMLATFHRTRRELPAFRAAEILGLRAIVAPATGGGECPERARLILIGSAPVDRTCVYGLARHLPRARVVGEARWVGDAGAMMAALRDPALDLGRSTVVLRHGEARPVVAPGVSGKVRWRRDEHDRIELDVETTAPGLLVLADAHYPGWTARVGDRAVPILLADGMMRAVPVPAGSSRVTFVFEPASVRAGLGITGAAGLLLLLLSLRRRRSP